MRVLVVEDDRRLADLLVSGLSEDGFAVDLARDGEDALWRTTTVDYDLVVLDLSLPLIDGLEVLRRMRTAGRVAPVLILSARDAIGQRVAGLDNGADDYLVKPFDWEELLARMRALLRRPSGGTDGRLRFRDLLLDPATKSVERGGSPLELTAREFQILHVLMAEPERVFSKTQIIEHVYDDEFDCSVNVVEVYLSRLRRKLNRPGSEPMIQTLRGQGYVLDAR